MIDNVRLKRGLITQSLSPLFLLLIIRHFHTDYYRLIQSFLGEFATSPMETIRKTLFHPMFGELLTVLFSSILVISSLISIPAFMAIQTSGFESHGEQIVIVEEKQGDAASFLMTFILPLFIDELNSLQKWLSYFIVIALVYTVLYQSNLYYQSPVLTMLNYKVFSFKVKNPSKRSGLKENTLYIGITKGKLISEEFSIIWKHITDDVFLIYNEGRRGRDCHWIRKKLLRS